MRARLGFLACACCAAAIQLDTTTYSLVFKVERGEFEKAQADVEAALAAAQAAGAVDGLTLLLRSAQAKVKKSLEELDARRAAEAKKAEETKEKHGERGPSADDSELAVRDDSSATAALSLPWVPSTRGEVKGEDCPNLSCKLSVRWAHQSRLGEGCERVFLDVGANVGLHGRFLFEPEKFPSNKYHKVFERVFGADWKDTGADAKMR